MRGLQAPNDVQPLVEFPGDECPNTRLTEFHTNQNNGSDKPHVRQLHIGILTHSKLQISMYNNIHNYTHTEYI
jgi:hypothetical protein